MKPDQRLWRILHVLIHMSHHSEPMTSQAIAEMLHTHPVVVRRTMAGLREGGFVSAEKGRGGGWRLLRELHSITLLDVYQALDEPTLLAVGPVLPPSTEEQACLVEKAVNQALEEVLTQVRQLLLSRFGQLSLAQIESDFKELLQARYPQISPEGLFCPWPPTQLQESPHV